MMKPWVKMPSEWIRNKQLVGLKWTDSGAPRSHKIAALQLFIAIALTSEEKFFHVDLIDQQRTSKRFASTETYDALMRMTGLSRSLVAGGLNALVKAGILEVLPNGKRNIYIISGFNGVNGWCKLPQRSMFGPDGAIIGFSALTKRNKYELYALKIWLYMLQVRDNLSPGVNASYEKINEGTGVPEKEIPRSYGILLSMGLLTRVTKETDDSKEIPKTSNVYYPVGYRDFFKGMKTSDDDNKVTA